jgi:hypothetical protein
MTCPPHNVVPIPDILDATAQAYINIRCRAAYLHDMRGELQTLNSCIELLSRAAQNAQPDRALKSSAMAKRAMTAHELSLSRTFDQMTLQDAGASTIDLAVLIQEAVQFLSNEAAGKSATFSLQLDSPLVVSTQAYACRLSILGLAVSLLDEAAPGAIIAVQTQRDQGFACIVFSAEGQLPAAISLDDLCSDSARVRMGSLPLFLAYASRWAANGGGHLHVTNESETRQRISIHCPVPAQLEAFHARLFPGARG